MTIEAANSHPYFSGSCTAGIFNWAAFEIYAGWATLVVAAVAFHMYLVQSPRAQEFQEFLLAEPSALVPELLAFTFAAHQTQTQPCFWSPQLLLQSSSPLLPLCK